MLITEKLPTAEAFSFPDPPVAVTPAGAWHCGNGWKPKPSPVWLAWQGGARPIPRAVAGRDVASVGRIGRYFRRMDAAIARRRRHPLVVARREARASIGA
jgi:hypothetical protein